MLASTRELPQGPYPVVQTLFLLLQIIYLAFYVGVLANLPEIQMLLSALSTSTEIFLLLIVTAALLIPARAFVLCMVPFRAPGATQKFLTMWPFLLAFDILWSLSPFLLPHHTDYGLALAFTAPLVDSPFAQRSLTLMGAAEEERSARGELWPSPPGSPLEKSCESACDHMYSRQCEAQR